MSVLRKLAWMVLAAALGLGSGFTLVSVAHHAHDNAKWTWSDGGSDRGLGSALPADGKIEDGRTRLSAAAPAIRIRLITTLSPARRALIGTIDALARTSARHRAPWRSPGHLRVGGAADDPSGSSS